MIIKKCGKVPYGWEFLDMTKTEVGVIKKLFESGIFDSIVKNLDIKELFKEYYEARFKQ